MNDVTLPDPLVMEDGTPVTDRQAWAEKRRPELLELFTSQVYGRVPDFAKDPLAARIVEEGLAFNGLAQRKQIELTYSGPGGEGKIFLKLYLPTQKTPPTACFLVIVNRYRERILLSEECPDEFWPAEDIVSRGFATAAFYYEDVALDDKQGNCTSGVFRAFYTPEYTRTNDSWGTIAAWAWGAHRAIDYLTTEPALDQVPIAVIGHSRGGKTALWCGAQDERVALAISNNSGCTGAAITRIKQGERVAVINNGFPHWFALNYRQYNDRENDLPIDQHQLLTLLAPRLVYVASASEDLWADPHAEFQSCVEASPVFELHGLKGIGTKQMPASGQPLHEGSIGYHLRTGAHALTREDWHHYLDFADIKFLNQRKA